MLSNSRRERNRQRRLRSCGPSSDAAQDVVGDLIGAVQQGPQLSGVAAPPQDVELVRKLNLCIACAKEGWLPELSNEARGWLLTRAHSESIENNRAYIEFVFSNYGVEILSAYLKPRRGPKRGSRKRTQ